MRREQIGDVTFANCWCELDLNDRIQPIKLGEECNTESNFDGSAPEANGVLVKLPNLGPAFIPIGNRRVLRLRMLLKGEFIRGHHAKIGDLRALDGDHIPKVDAAMPPNPDWIRPHDKRSSGNGTEGTRFESWFSVELG